MIIFIIIFLVILYICEQWSKENALNGIEFQYSCSKLMAEAGESFELITTITNTSYRFVPFLKIEEFLPEHVDVLTEGAAIKIDAKGGMRHISSVYLMPKSKLVRKVRLSIKKRGRYVFKGCELYGGDFLGISEERKTVNQYNEIVIYPARVNAPEIASVLGGVMGDISVRRFILEDPVLTVGAREYTGREPMKSISWNHSARGGGLMVKQFDYTIDPSISILMDIECDNKKGSHDIVEKVYSLTRTVCEDLENSGMKYDFISNARTADVISRWSYLSEGIGARHFFTILEGLGRAAYDYTESFSQVMDKLCDKQAQSRSTIVITVKNDDYRRENILRLEKRTQGKAYLISAEDYMDK